MSRSYLPVATELLLIVFSDLLVPSNGPILKRKMKYDSKLCPCGMNSSENIQITLIVGFDVPVNAATECYLKFTLPWATESNWVVTGSGLLDYYGLSRPVDHQHDCWNSRPQRVPPNALGQIQVFPGMDGVVTGKFPCHMGTRMDFELAACKPKGPTYVHWYGEYQLCRSRH